ncbi:MAG: hypothetical protein Q7S84_03650 [bacterium]|nr:hypothetical protein [bacterium]
MRQKQKEYLRTLGFPTSGGKDELIDPADGTINADVVAKRIFKFARGKRIMVAFHEEASGPLTVIEGRLDCIANIFGSHLELTQVKLLQGDIATLDRIHYQRAGERQKFLFCCADFARRHDPSKDDLLVVDISTISHINMDGERIYACVPVGDRCVLRFGR